MKLTTNFALPVRKTMQAVYWLSLITSLAGLAFVYYLGLDRRTLLNENISIKRDVETLKDKSRAMTISPPYGSDSAFDIASVRSRIERINSISPIKGVSANQLLAAIEKILPDHVSVDRLSYSAIDGKLHIVAESADVERIYTFMKRLEQNPMFTSPELQQKPGQELMDSSVMQFEIDVVVH